MMVRWWEESGGWLVISCWDDKVSLPPPSSPAPQLPWDWAEYHNNQLDTNNNE